MHTCLNGPLDHFGVTCDRCENKRHWLGSVSDYLECATQSMPALTDEYSRSMQIFTIPVLP